MSDSCFHLSMVLWSFGAEFQIARVAFGHTEGGSWLQSALPATGHIAGLLTGSLLSLGISPLYNAADIDLDNRELQAEKRAKMSSKPLPDRQKAEEEAAEIARKALAVDKTSIWAKLLLPLVYSSFFVGSVAYILTDRIGHLPPAKWLPDLF